MDTVIYFVLTGGYFILFILSILLAKRYGWLRIENVLLIVILALLYDNGILAFGKYIGEGEFLQSLNYGRYWLHAFVTPLLVLFSWKTLVNVDIHWAKRKIVWWIFIALTILFIISEVISAISIPYMESTWSNGVLSYKEGGDGNSPPIMIIGVSTVLLIASLLIWWKQRWPWFFIGILSMGILPLINLLLNRELPHNISEFLLMIGLIATQAYQLKRL